MPRFSGIIFYVQVTVSGWFHLRLLLGNIKVVSGSDELRKGLNSKLGVSQFCFLIHFLYNLKKIT